MPERVIWIASASVPVRLPEPENVWGMSAFAATSARSSKTMGERVEPRLITGPGAEVVASLLVLVDPGRVGGVRDVDGDRQGRLEVEGGGPGAVEADLLLGVGHAGDPARDLVGLGAAARDLQRDVGAEAVVHRARDEARALNAHRLAADHGRVADPHQLTGGVAVLGADVDVKLLELDDLLSLLVLEQVDRLAAGDARDRPVLRHDLDPLADEDLRVPAADRRRTR